MARILIGNIKGPKGDKGERGLQGTQGPQGLQGIEGPQGKTGASGPKGATGARGSVWYSGTVITGTNATGTIFENSGIASALVNDMYLNTSTGAVYKCVTAGAATVAKWAYVGSIRGATGPAGAVDANTKISFTPAATRDNVASGESIKTIFGKIAKWYTDFKAAFSTIVNNGTTTVAGTVLDGRMGKTLLDKINALNSLFANYYKKAETYSRSEVDTKVNSKMPTSGGTFSGGITVNNGDIKANRHVRVATSQKVIWDTDANIMSNGKQHLYFMGSDDGNYTAHLGVHDNMWTLDPDVNGRLNLGTANHKWGTLYAVNGTIATSDRTLKKDICEIDDKYIDFFMRLMPVSFRFNDGIRTHIGFIAQDVEEAMAAAGLTDLDFAGFCRDAKTVRIEKTKTVKVGRRRTKTVTYYDDVEVPGEYIYSLRYDEFIALNTAMIQRIYARVTALENKM